MPEHTISENLTRLVNATEAIGSAITAKGGTVNNGDGLEEFVTDIGTIPSGGGSADISDVNFYDYDGTVVYSYTASEFAALTAMPDNPSHEGLTAQGWNWSIADAKSYVADYGKLNIGQMYKTDDGALRLYIRLQEGRLSPVLALCPNGTLTVDWGDGSATETITGSSTSTLVYLGHTYASAGNYVISVLPSAGSTFGFGQRNTVSTILCNSQNDSANNRQVYLNAIYKIQIPDGVTSIGNSAFARCYGLGTITIPDSVTSIGSSAFSNCQGLGTIIIPDSVTSIGNSAFAGCYGLGTITIPDSGTSIGNSAFASCQGLGTITIPDSVTSIGSYAFNSCYGLGTIIIPDRVTRIDNYTFARCYGLGAIIIPDRVTRIGSYAFNNCYGLGTIKFMSTTPATVSSSNAWTDIPTDCIIYIPLNTYTTYTNATNYPNSEYYNYVEYATYASGATLPSTNTGGTRTYTWYATIEDWLAQTNPITVGNGKEIYCRSAAV